MQMARFLIVLTRLALGHTALQYEGYRFSNGDIPVFNDAVAATSFSLGASSTTPPVTWSMLDESTRRENTTVLANS